MKFSSAFVAAVLCVNGPELAVGRSLRRGDRSLVTVATEPAAISTPAEIKEKWGKMDEFLKVMFTMACKWKHGKDVNGLAAEKLKNGELEGKEVADFKKQVQADNLQGLTQACGMIVASGKKNCRQSCADSWGEAMEKRNECDGQCVTVYTKFEASCKDKEANLEKVYAMKASQTTARKRCYEGFCNGFPTVWMKEDAAAMEEERGKQCEAQCTEDAIKVMCRQKWQLEVDFIRMDITTACFEEGKVKECYDGKKTTASATQDTCSSGGKADCDTAFSDCQTQGKTDATFKEAEGFCTDRKKMCETQVVDKCLKEHKAALDAAQKECEKGDEEALKTCEAEKLAAKETEDGEACVAEKTPKCPTDCADKCPVDKLDGCLKNLEGTGDATQSFCEDFWGLLHDSSEVDPVTGNPIVLLASK